MIFQFKKINKQQTGMVSTCVSLELIRDAKNVYEIMVLVQNGLLECNFAEP